MDKVMSARLDEAVIDEMEKVGRRLKLTKKRFLEQAIKTQIALLSTAADTDIWAETSGIWKSPEKTEVILEKVRRPFRRTFSRHHAK